ncbi:MAG: hypothetical protein WD826_09525 [Actinomycetota bacterium]
MLRDPVTTDVPVSAPVSVPVSARGRERRRGTALGIIAGTIGLGCCVYPVVLVLFGLSSASAAVDLGNVLYGRFGWAFKGAAVAFAVAAVWIQRRRAMQCAVDRRPDVRRTTLWLVARGLAAYALLYAATKGLASIV